MSQQDDLPMQGRHKLCETIDTKAFRLGLVKSEMPSYIADNLRYELFEWQKDAFTNFLTYQGIRKEQHDTKPTHLLFNMATGSGKTLLMAALLLHYYQNGYRHFIFFVNRNNIVDKTENNFLHASHNKYLFVESIVIHGKTVPIKSVQTFSDNPIGIEIHFTSVQKLYNDIHLARENRNTLEDLHKRDLVLLADEAHHLNADTQSSNQKEIFLIGGEITGRTGDKEVERLGWEHTTITLLLNKNHITKMPNKNVLLEFTATIPDNATVQKKYHDKIIYEFPLKKFLRAGYTKQINLISSTLTKKERILQALVFNWYRHKVALKHNITHFKPVILFRSKTIDESKQDHAKFLDITQNVKTDDFEFLKKFKKIIDTTPSLYERGKSRTDQVLQYIKSENISFSEIADFIQVNFSERYTIITNSKTNKNKTEQTNDEQEALLNNLEHPNNYIRAIFTVARLTEGWDVLNLFDIVRLSEGQNAGGTTRNIAPATVQEKQLIGRGVRYFPFSYGEEKSNKRKFDDDLDHELRILEELFYYSDKKSQYIADLKKALRDDGYIDDQKELRAFHLKDEFKQTDFFKTAKIWYNQQQANHSRKTKSLDYWNISTEYTVPSLELIEEWGLGAQENEKTQQELKIEGIYKTITWHCKEIDRHIFQKAVNQMAKEDGSVFCFENLKNNFAIDSVRDLQKPEVLGNFSLTMRVGEEYTSSANITINISAGHKLIATKLFLRKVAAEVRGKIPEKIGTEFALGNFKEFFSRVKEKTVDKKNCEASASTANDMKGREWYVLNDFVGTSEEQEFVKFFSGEIWQLEKKYREFYLVRNEEVYKIYNFKDGVGFQPDFLLFLTGVGCDPMHYQIYIEPKGGQWLDKDRSFKSGKEGWKEDFLAEITERYGINDTAKDILQIENDQYRLIGLPFFNKDNNKSFEAGFKELHTRQTFKHKS